jgi:predicted DNA-binding protein (MmcQ/YjbR family)
MSNAGALDRIRAICLSLPDTKETPTWGKPHFRVGEKIFAGCDEDGGAEEDRGEAKARHHRARVVVSFKLAMGHAFTITQMPGFWPAPYVGHKGWVSMDVTRVTDWDAVRELILESYRLIAPKKSVVKLDANSAGATGADRAPAGAATGRARDVRPKPSAAKPTSSRASSRPSRRKAAPTSGGARGRSRTRSRRAPPRPR